MKVDFEQADGRKIQAIEKAAMQEFAARGYDLASTNNIVKNAGISKGLLFHYFKSKADLYEYMVVRCIDLLVEYLYERIDFSESDLFERLKQIGRLKMEIFREYPYLYEFVMRTNFSESNAEMKQLAAGVQQERLKDIEQNTLKGVDYTRFKEGLDIEKSMTVLSITAEEIVKRKTMEGNIDMEEVYELMNGYLDYFKKLFCK